MPSSCNYTYVNVCFRDRINSFWQSVRDHLYELAANATEHTFLLERTVVGLLRLAIRLLRREEIASQVTACVLFAGGSCYGAAWTLLCAGMMVLHYDAAWTLLCAGTMVVLV